MKDFVKTLDDLPRIVKFILVLIGDLFANVYRLCRLIAKNNVLGIILAVLLLLTGGFLILWIIDLVMIVVKGTVWWID